MLIARAINEIHRSLCVCSINCDIGEIWSVHFENVVRNVGIRENIRDSPINRKWMDGVMRVIASRHGASMNCRGRDEKYDTVKCCEKNCHFLQTASSEN